MKKKIMYLTVLSMILAISMMFSMLSVSAAAATPESRTTGVPGNGNFNGTAGNTALQISGDETLSVRFSLSEPTIYIGLGCPSWGDNVGCMTLSLYAFKGDYESSIEASPLIQHEFVDYYDNAYLGFSYTREDPLPTGEYILRLSDPYDDGGTGVGVWLSDGCEYQEYYKDDDVVEDVSIRMYVQYASEPEPTATPIPSPTPIPTPDTQEKQYLYKEGAGTSTGWWIHPFVAGTTITVDFTANKDFNGFHYFRYASSTPVPIIIEIFDEYGESVWISKEDYMCSGDGAEDIWFDKILAPGYYTLTFTSGEVEDNTNMHYVLASSDGDDDTADIMVSGGNTNQSTKTNPYIHLLVCPPDENATPRPTKAPVTPSPVPTPTVAKTTEPAKETNAPAKATKAPVSGETENEDSNAGVIIAVVVAAIVVLGAVAIIIITKKKKQG